MQYHLNESCLLGLTLTLLTLHVINSLLHGFGTYILWKIVQRENAKPQHIFLLGLSTSEFIMNVLEAIRLTPTVVHHNFIPVAVRTFSKYLQMITFSGAWLVFYLMMVYITTDRLFLIIMKARYDKIMSRQKAIIIFMIT